MTWPHQGSVPVGLVLIQGGASDRCQAIVGHNSDGHPIYCNGKGYQYTDYIDVNGRGKKRVTVCPRCGGSGKA